MNIIFIFTDEEDDEEEQKVSDQSFLIVLSFTLKLFENYFANSRFYHKLVSTRFFLRFL